MYLSFLFTEPASALSYISSINLVLSMAPFITTSKQYESDYRTSFFSYSSSSSIWIDGDIMASQQNFPHSTSI